MTLDEEEVELDVLLTTELLELEMMTGLRLLYIDNLLAPPHCLISYETPDHKSLDLQVHWY